MRRWAWSRRPGLHRQPPHYGCGVLLIELRRRGPRVSFHLGKFHRQRAAGAPLRIRTETERLLEPPPLPVGLGELRTGRVSRTPVCGFGDRRPAVGPDPYRPPAARLQAGHLRGGHGVSLAEAHQSPVRSQPHCHATAPAKFPEKGSDLRSPRPKRGALPVTPSGSGRPTNRTWHQQPSKAVGPPIRTPRWAPRGLNAQPPAFQTGALPIELSALRGPGTTRTSDRLGVNQLL